MAGVQRCMVEHPTEVWTPGLVMDKSSGWTVKTDTGEVWLYISVLIAKGNTCGKAQPNLRV